MSILSRLIELRATKGGSSSLNEPQDWLLTALGAQRTVTGKTVSETSALSTVAVYACVTVLASTVATLPLPVYRRLAGGGKERAPEHRLYGLLHDAPNPEMSAVEFREALMGHLALWGNAYAEIERDRAGRPLYLWPLRPDYMAIKRDGNSALLYEYTVGGSVYGLSADRVLHIRGLSNDGIAGYGPISLAREAIGMAGAVEEYGARFFGNDSSPGGILVHPGKLSKPAKDNLKAGWEMAHSGLANKHRVAVLEEGVKWEAVGIPPADSQFLETRKFQATEICRLFRIPPHMIGDLDRATFSNIEHQSLEFVIHTIRPWTVRWEQAIQRALFAPQERSTYFAEHVIDGLLRGDIQSRYQAYAIGRANGWLSADDIRELENMNPLPDDQGKIYLVPMNMVPADQLTADSVASSGGVPPSTPPEEQQSEPSERAATEGRPYEERAASGRRKLARSYGRLFEDAARRMVKREEADVMRAAERMLGKRDTQSFIMWLEDFYRDHPAYTQRVMLPVLLAYADAISEDAAFEIGTKGGMDAILEQFVRDYAKIMSQDEAYSSLGQLRQVVRDAEQQQLDPLTALGARFAEWGEKRPGKLAGQHTVEAAGAVTHLTWKRGGVRRIRWHAYGENCPYCNSLNGKVVGIDEQFINKDEDFNPDGADGPLRPSRHVRHAPAHAGCNCDIAPER